MVQDQVVLLVSVPELLLLLPDQHSKLLPRRFIITITPPQLALLPRSVAASAVAVLAVLSPLVWPWVLVQRLLTRPSMVSWEAAAAMEMLLNNSSRHLSNSSQFSMLSQLSMLSPFMSSPLNRLLNSRTPA